MVTVASWAQPTDVLNVTGVQVTPSQVLQAQSSIEILCGRSFAVPVDTLKTRDLHYLKLAVAYQCAWLRQQPDFFGRSDLSSINQDGMSITYDPATGGKAVVCAPLARRAMRRLSWMKSRSMHTTPVGASSEGIGLGDPIVDYEGEDWRQSR